MMPAYSFVQQAATQTRDVVQTGIAHTKSAYGRISDEDGPAVDKAVAITAGGLLGVVLSARKGFFKKILYTTAGVGAMAIACYPKQANEMVELTTFIARKKGPEIIKEYAGFDVSGYLPAQVL